ncbi:polysaccharide lyase family 8 super-sandwich domain-containing protein [Streptomyces sp. NBC_00059]|uniref:polysaccharide lyase family 8 super-sandwich domain-containing protein n=1 Tax=Streptomyces sp. NBC_00059 TaxID=2975635 RepID=UPI00224ED11F|nr:polysaccharide lyase family 8 super-sandwich domain-containing protein [Streptomyces sp. NBC_00059]MCX5411166.1 polysaccharide lyase beta-sandwich domain-containing protein [Streptomyces sp. NBC_00059]
MDLSRRSALAVIPAATLWALARTLRAEAATARDPAGAADGDSAALLRNTVAIFAGTAESNARPDVAPKLASIRATAQARLAALDGAGQDELFAGVPLGTSDPNLNTSYQYLYEIALATALPGTDGSGPPDSTAVRRRVIDGLARLHDGWFGDQSKGYYGNWFHWEIGIPAYVTKTLVLLRDELAAYRPDLTATYIASMDAYLRNGKDGDVDLDSRFHTGANLADITTNRILQGALLGDEARITKALADQLTVYSTIDPYHPRHGVTDGFHADGSFVQHSSVAYTGSYGKGLLTRIVQTIKILDGTGYVPDDGLVGTVLGWVTDGFAPLIFEGWMMEIVKGRAVSRTGTGYVDVTAVVEAVVDLSAHTAATDTEALTGYVKYVRQTSKAGLDPASFVSPVSIARYADLLNSPVPANDLGPAASHTAFNAMDRTVHRRPGYAFALARSSARISAYEYMSGENLMPWFQGSGAHYLYLSGTDQRQAFGIDYFTAVPPHRLAGVTAPVETRRTVPELYGTLWYDNPERGFTSSSASQNTYVYFPRATNAFSGGARLGAYGLTGLVLSDDAAYAAQQEGTLPEDFVAYRAAGATRSWFMFDDEILVLSAGVTGLAGRAATTTVDSRIANPSAPVTLTGGLRDGSPWDGSGPGAPAWLRYADEGSGSAVGYVFLSGPPPVVSLDTVTRSRRLVRLSNADTPVTKQLFTLSYEHAAGEPPASMAHALVPNASARRLASYADGPLSVLSNTVCLQAVAHMGLGITAANSFTPGTHRAGRLAVEGPASVMLRRTARGTCSLAVADPTTERRSVSVTLHGRPLRCVSADDGVRVRPVPGGTRIDVTTHHAYGRSFTATLTERD